METRVLAAQVLISVCLVCILALAWRVLDWVWLRPKLLEKKLREQGLSGNSYRLLVGDLKDSSRMARQAKSQPINLSQDIVPRVLPFDHHTIKAYGKNSFRWLGPIPRVHVMDPEELRTVFAKINDFQKPKLNPLIKLLAVGLANVEGDEWAKHRKIINPAFHVEKLKRMVPAFYQSVSEMVNNWETLVSGGASCEVDVWPYLQNLSRDAISRTAFGSSFEEGKRIFLLQRELAEIGIQSVQRGYLPGWRFLPTKMNMRAKEIDKDIKSSLTAMIKKRVKAIEAGETTNDDLLGILLESNRKEIQEHGNNKNVGLSITDVIEECKLFHLAGQETTSVLLVWTMILLGKHCEWQERARKEVLQVFGDKKPDFDGLSRLKVVTMILNEVLRLYPPVPLLSRKVIKETRLGNFTFPAGVLLALPILLVHQDTQLWGEDAKEFKPERFSEGISKATKNNRVPFSPFGWGPRICIGMNFAMTEAKMALSMILQRFRFELSPSYAHAPLSLITVQPQHGAHVILHKL